MSHLEINRKKREELYDKRRMFTVEALWYEGSCGCSQKEEHESEERIFRANVNDFERGKMAAEAGFDNYPVAAFFGGVPYMFPLGFGCPLQYQGDLVISMPGFTRENPPVLPKEPWKCGLYPMVFERIEKFQKQYPEIPLTVSDTQSPIDVITELLKAEDAILLFYDDPDLAHRILDDVTNFIININRYFEKKIHNFAGFSGEGYLPKGIHLSDDNAAYLSPDIYEEFALPYANRLSQEFGGVEFHVCMKFEQNLKQLASAQGFMGYDAMPYYNSVDKILNAMGENKVWTIYNYPWTIPSDETEPHIDFFKRIIDRTEKRVQLRIQVQKDKKEDAIRLADQVKEYCLKKGWK